VFGIALAAGAVLGAGVVFLSALVSLRATPAARPDLDSWLGALGVAAIAALVGAIAGVIVAAASWSVAALVLVLVSLRWRSRAVRVAGEIGWVGMRPMTDEALIAANPDLILVMTKGIESAGGVDGLLENKQAIALTAAGQHRRFVDMADGDILSFGPRSAGVLDALARAIYAPES
jgi:hypothetical protein